MIINWFCNADIPNTITPHRDYMILTFLNIEGVIIKIASIVEEHKELATLHGLLLEEMRNTQISLGFPPEFRYWILICGLFNWQTRNIIKFWKDHEKMLLELVK